ncbi:MAG TPA: BMP family ABC transporter substrate-binding protein [Ignavibacteria bacterium]|nr:BMP family ABC transporter substrate-binding protein [Ignavibacteria bacterium]HRJ98025.1 BMP family ABC transporter substrate-binding protein [Ignavibacteria bacterium]
MKIIFTALFTAVLCFSFNACGKKEAVNESGKETETSAAPKKVGLVFDIGGRGDKSFNDAAYKGLEEAKEKLGIDFEVIDPGDGSDRESALRKLASKKDVGLVFGVGFIFTDDINNIAKEFPDKKFACVDYSIDPSKQIPANVEAIEFKEEEGSFLVGVIAALNSKTKKVGFIGGMESNLIRKFEDGYKQGVKYADPDCQVLSGYVSVSPEGFKNPGKAKEIALSQYNSGADIIYHASGLSGLGLFEAAREKNKFAIGVDMDQQKEAPGFVMTSMVKLVDRAVFNTVKDFTENKFTGGIKTFGLLDNGVSYVYDENNKSLISEEIILKTDEAKKKLSAGEIKIELK